jgi:4a-hydroxytetrahydrobiopterin dehydratase
MSDTTLGQADLESADVPDWRMFGPALQTRFRTGNFANGLRLLNAIGEAAELANHHPDLDLRYPHLNVKLYSHDAGGVTDRDVALARRISELAAEQGVTAAPSEVEVVELALDTPDYNAIKPFWRAALGYKDNPRLDDELRNDDGAHPMLWFQESGSEEPRQRFHIDVRVPKEVAQPRIDAAVAAGGKVVDEAKTFVVIADPEGNKVCICS